MKPLLRVALFLSAAIIGMPAAFGQLPAFPGAEGAGAYAVGGRGGDVYHVVNLNSSGAGSFANGITTVPPGGRTIVFDVSGYINISGTLTLNAAKVTIAGQTAPGDGIGVKNGTFNISAGEVIIRHFRFRDGNSADSLDIDTDSTNSIIDHCDTMLSNDENFSSFSSPPENVTFQWSINAWGMETHSAGGLWDQMHATAHHTLWSHNHTRNPKARPDGCLDWINNVTFDWDIGFIMGDSETPANWKANVLGCYFVCPPGNIRSVALETATLDRNGNPNFTIYVDDCKMDDNGNGLLDFNPAKVGYALASGAYATNATPFANNGIPVTRDDPLTAYKKIVSAAGPLRMEADAAKPLRDEINSILVSNLVNQLAHHVSAPAETGAANGGFGFLNSAPPPLDTDQDGMPDFWEDALGSDSGSDDHNNQVPAGAFLPNVPAGYTLLEEYLQFLAMPHGTVARTTPTNQTFLNVDLSKFASGFVTAPVVFSISNVVNGSVLLLAGHLARFSPETNFSGRASFEFTVTDGDGGAWKQTVAVLVLPASIVPAQLAWRGDGTVNIWDEETTPNWFDGSGLVTFKNGDAVTFDDSGSNSPALNLSGSLAPGIVTVNAVQDYTFGGTGTLIGPGRLIKSGPGKLTINVANTLSAGTTISGGILQLGDGVSANGGLSGNVTNNAVLIFASASALSSAASISGSGPLTKNGPGTLTLSGTQTYTNLTTINAGTLEFSGTPPPGNVMNNSVLTFKPSIALTYAGTIGGSGGVLISGSGLTTTLSGPNTFTGGINITTGNLQLGHNQAAGTGPVTNSSSGLVYVANGVVVTNDFTLTTSTTDLNMRNDSGTGTWAGNVVNMGSGASWRPGSDGGTLIFTGTALQGSRNFIVPRGTFQMASNAVISATGSATAFGRDTTGGNRSANVTIRDNAVITLGVCNLGGNQAGGNVTLTIQNNATLNCGANNFDLQNVNRATAVTTIRLNGGTFTVGGLTKTKTSQTNVIQFNGGVLKAGANNVSFLPAFSFATNNVQAGGAKIDDGGFTLTIPAPLAHDPALGATIDGGLTKLGSGLTLLSGASGYTGPTMIFAGRLDLVPGGLLNGSSGIYIDAAGTFSVANFGGAYTLGSGRVISGNGAVLGKLVIGSGAVLAPGSNAIGGLTFNNPSPSLTLAAGSTNIFEINHSPLTNDSVRIFGALTNGGTLIVTNVGPTALAAGDSFKLFDAASYSGAFANVVLPSLDPGLAWNKAFLNTAGTLSVVVKTPPLIESTTLSGNNVVLSGSGGVPAATFYVQTSTNVALPLDQWPRLLTNQFDSTGHFAVTNAMNQALPASFYLLQVP